MDTSELGECVRKRDPIDVEVDDTLDPDLAAVFVEVPEEVRRIAEAAQIRRPIAELVRARSQQTAAAPLALQLQLVARLSVLEIEASALLFEALLQIARDGSGDQYAQQASFFRASFEREMDRAQPITDVKGSGRGFRWARG